MLDLDKYKEYEILNFLLRNYLNNWYESIYSIYITPYYKIKKEYRIYYIYDKKKDKTNIYSIKNRTNEQICNIFELNNYTIDKDVKVIWNYTLREDFLEDKRLYKFISKIAKKLNYDKWVIEFFEDNNNNLIYSEINTLWACLMFKQDQDNMIEYYKNIWDIID